MPYTGTNTVNGILRVFGGGAYHLGIKAYGMEFAFGSSLLSFTEFGSNDTLREGEITTTFPEAASGVRATIPEHFFPHKYFKRTFHLGSCGMPRHKFYEYINEKSEFWPRGDYDLLNHNCHDFARSVQTELKLGPIPKYTFRNTKVPRAFKKDAGGQVRSRRINAQLQAAALELDCLAPNVTGGCNGAHYWQPDALEEVVAEPTLIKPENICLGNETSLTDPDRIWFRHCCYFIDNTCQPK